MAEDRDRSGLIDFFGYSILAGGNAVGIRFSNLELDPVWGATLRFSLAALLMVGLMVFKKQRLPTGAGLLGAAIYGFLTFGLAFALAFYALVELEAGFGQILLSVVPLVTLLLAVAQGLEKMKIPSLVGSLLAVVGVVVMSGLSLEGPTPILPLLAVMAAGLCFAQAALVVKRFPPVPPIALNAVGMTVGAVVLVALTLVTGSEVRLPTLPETWWALGYMVVVGSVLVFTLYVTLLERWDASRANYGFVVIPVVTVLVSAWLLDERITGGLVVGGALVLAGVYYGALRPGRAAAAHLALNKG